MRRSGWIASSLLGALFGFGVMAGCSGSSKVVTPEQEGGVGGQGGEGGSTNQCEYTLNFAVPQSGATLTEKDDADGDNCGNGLQYEVVVATNAPDGTVVRLYSSAGELGKQAVQNGEARFPNVTLTSHGTETLRADIVETTCETEISVTTNCSDTPACQITKPKITPEHPLLNGVPVSEGGDRVSADGQPYQTAFEVTTTIQDGQPVVLTVEGQAAGITAYAKGGKAEFAGVHLEPGKEQSVYAECIPKAGKKGHSGEVTYKVDVEAPPFTTQKSTNNGTISELQDGDHFAPEDDADKNKQGLQMRICGSVKKDEAADALNLESALGQRQNNFCVAVGTSSPVCAPAKKGGGPIGSDGACVDIDCPGSGPFNLTVSLRDRAGNPEVHTFQGVTCASKNPQVQLVTPVDSGNPARPTKILAFGAAAPNLADKDKNKPGAQFDVIACTNATAGNAILLAGPDGGALAQIGSAKVAPDTNKVCKGAGMDHVVRFADATIPESIEDNNGNLSKVTVLRVELTDINHAKGASEATLWVDSYPPTLKEHAPLDLCGKRYEADKENGTAFYETVYLRSDGLPVSVTVTNSKGTQSYHADKYAYGSFVKLLDSTGLDLVKFYKGTNSIKGSTKEPSGNVGTLRSPCVVTVGNPPKITWNSPQPGSLLAAHQSSGPHIIPDADGVAAGWQGNLKVCVSRFDASTKVTFSSSVDGNLGSATVDASGCATLSNVTLSENDSTTLTATATYDGETGSGSVIVPVDVHPPSGISSLSATVLDRRQTSFHLQWNAPADGNKAVASYIVKVSESPFTTPGDFENAKSIPYTGKPAQPGKPDALDASDLLIEHQYYFAVRAVDVAGNLSPIVSVGPKGAHFKKILYTGSDNEYMGFSADGSASINGDAYSDLVIGSRNSRSVRLYFGTSNGLPAQPDVELAGRDTGFGLSVAFVGDIDGDKMPELAVSSPAGEGHGAVYIFKGRTTWPSILTQDQADYVISGDATYDGANFGWRIVPLGDVDKNGFADFAFGASYYHNGDGQEIIVLGGPSLPKKMTLPTDFGKHAIRVSPVPDHSGHLGTNALGLGIFYSNPPNQTSFIVLETSYTANSNVTRNLYAFHGYGLADSPLSTSNASHSISGSKASRLGYALGILRVAGSSYPNVVVSRPEDTNPHVLIYSGSSAAGPFDKVVCKITNSVESNRFGIALNTGTFSGTAVSTSFIGDSTPDIVIAGKAAGTFNGKPASVYIIDGNRITKESQIDAGTSADVIAAALPTGWVYSSQYTTPLKDSNGDGYGDIVLGDFFGGSSKNGHVLILW